MNDSSQRDHDQLFELARAVCEGTITAQESAQLANLLTDNASLQSRYLDYLDVHADLRWRFREGVLQDQLTAQQSASKDNLPLPLGSKEGPPSDQRGDRPDAVALCEAPGRGEGLREQAPTPAPRPKSLLNWASRNPKGPAIAVAATLLIAALVVMGLVPVKEWVAGKGKKGKGDEFVAKLSNWQNDKWLEDTRPPRDDPRLKNGRRLKIESGLIEVTYFTGARVVIEGPAEFWVGSQASGDQAVRQQEDPSRVRKSADFANSGYLKLGSLVARVEGENAQGFTIDTPAGRVEDLGTEFGVEVRESGAAEFVVLSGKVDVIREASPGVVAERIRLTRDQGVIVHAGGARIARRTKVDASLIAAMRERINREFETSVPRTDATAATISEDFSSGTSGPNMRLGTSTGWADFSKQRFIASSGGPGRIYLGTHATDYSSVDFVFSGEVTTGTSDDSDGNVYFGMGSANASSTARPTFGLPSTVPNVFVQLEDGVDRLDSSDNQTSAFTLKVEGNADWGGGRLTHKVQMTWSAASKSALIEIDRLNDGSVDFSFTVDGSDNGFDATNSAVFVGGADGATWDNLSITISSVPESNREGVPPKQ